MFCCCRIVKNKCIRVTSIYRDGINQMIMLMADQKKRSLKKENNRRR
jgi:hypothetical protein